MERFESQEGAFEAAQALVEELLRTGFALIDLISALVEELPEDAFPGEQRGEVLLEMISGSSLPAVRAAGERDVRAATALVGAVRDRVLEDLRAAAELARAES